MVKIKSGLRVVFRRMPRVEGSKPDGIYVNVTEKQLHIHYAGVDAPGRRITVPNDVDALRELAQGLLDVADYWEAYENDARVRWP